MQTGWIIQPSQPVDARYSGKVRVWPNLGHSQKCHAEDAMTWEDLFAYVLAGAVILAVVAIVIIGANASAPKSKKARSRSRYTHGIDDAPVKGDPSSD